MKLKFDLKIISSLAGEDFLISNNNKFSFPPGWQGNIRLLPFLVPFEMPKLLQDLNILIFVQSSLTSDHLSANASPCRHPVQNKNFTNGAYQLKFVLDSNALMIKSLCAGL